VDARKETDVKPQRGGEQRLVQRPQVRESRSEDPPATAAPAISADETAVLECLRVAPGGLTAKQLQSRVACDRQLLEQTLRALVDRELVVRLNTIIPSFAYRSGGLSTHER